MVSVFKVLLAPQFFFHLNEISYKLQHFCEKSFWFDKNLDYRCPVEVRKIGRKGRHLGSQPSHLGLGTSRFVMSKQELAVLCELCFLYFSWCVSGMFGRMLTERHNCTRPIPLFSRAWTILRQIKKVVKIRHFNKIQIIFRRNDPDSKRICLSEKKFLGLGAL